MDLGGRANMDLTEAARLMKQSTATPTGTNPAQLQTPPLMMMQQAVAMQQFQFQQALLMQQVMATQQAAARAATVKSAAEMAAARAAEISKQLKGSDGEDEEKKPTSPDRSRSASRSKSRSPIRYRRDRSRSLSRSPIRYRRDRPYSPSRSRDHFSYRSRSRRGYYRGRGDYPWNPFRREWDRDRDRNFYSRSRRSRSRSRSRVRRRSRSRSRSPRFRRERSVSPRHRRDDRKATRSARRSKSRDLKRTPSVSSRSPSANPHGKEGSRSPSIKQQGSGLSPVRRGPSGSPGPQIGRRVGKDLSPSPLEDDQIRSLDYKGRGDRVQMKAPSLETDSLRKSGLPKTGPSVSPRRSPSVSFNDSLGKDLQSDDDEDVNSDLKRTTSLRVSSNGEDDTGDIQPDLASVNPNFPSQALKGMGSGSDISSEGGNVDFKAKEQFLGKQSRSPRRGERSAKDSGVVPGQESDDDKELDDWRDDMKAHSKEKIRRKDERKGHDKKNEEDSRLVTENNLGRSRIEVSWDTSRATKKHGLGDSDIDMEQLDDDSGRDRHGRIDVGGGKERWQDSSRDKVRSFYEVKDYVVSEVNDTGGAKYVDKEFQEQGKEKSVESVKEDERDLEETVFEGPKLEVEEDEGFFESVRPVKMDEYKNTERDVDQVSKHPRARDDSDVEDEEEMKVTRSKLVTLEDDVIVSRKGKEKSRPKDRRVDEEEEREKRKERHRKHKKKHRREAEDEKDEDEDDNDDVEGRKERRRHKRKHRKEDDDERRERKKRKHKSRGKSGSDSAGESSRADVEVKDEDDGSPVRKKSSSRHRKRRRDPSKSPANSASSSD
ncbi:hypothetical protein Mapa_014946 [Marchantia paleacea]|nr:hypothetical protein Mapa_014946 [Marchantia paleacea]